MACIRPRTPVSSVANEALVLLWRYAQPGDIDALVEMNRSLQREEGAEVMTASQIRRRFDRWFEADAYRGVLFEHDHEVVAYALFRDTDPDSEGNEGVYLRQFFVRPKWRRRGCGKAAFRLWQREVVPPGKRILLEVAKANPVGYAFWQSVGGEVYSFKIEWRS